MAVQQDRRAIVDRENFFLLLGQSDDREIAQVQRQQTLPAGVQLTEPAINDNQVRQWFAIFELPLVAARHDFRHHRKVVDAFDRFYPEMPVRLLCRSAADEADHAADGEGAGDVRNVETLDRRRRFLELQDLLQLRDPGVAGVVRHRGPAERPVLCLEDGTHVFDNVARARGLFVLLLAGVPLHFLLQSRLDFVCLAVDHLD